MLTNFQMKDKRKEKMKLLTTATSLLFLTFLNWYSILFTSVHLYAPFIHSFVYMHLFSKTLQIWKYVLYIYISFSHQMGIYTRFHKRCNLKIHIKYIYVFCFSISFLLSFANRCAIEIFECTFVLGVIHHPNYHFTSLLVNSNRGGSWNF